MAATPPKQPAQKFPVIIIIAASIGGATVLAAALMGVYFCCCKRRRKPKAPVGDDFFAPPTSIVAPTSRQPQLPVIPPIPKTRTQSGRWARRSSTPAWPLKDEVPVAAAWNRRTPSPSPPPPSYQGRARPQMMVERLGTTAGREYAAGPVARGYVPPAWGQAGGFVHAERSMGERYGGECAFAFLVHRRVG